MKGKLLEIRMSLLNPNRISSDIILSKYFNQPNVTLGSGTLFSNYNDDLNKINKHVTLKIDVSHTNHSHIIGRYGWNIKTIMMITQCRIHFPDSNRNSSIIKSNQVSISGQLENVEKARRIIRDILPITFTFEIPYLNNENLRINQNSPVIQQIQNVYDVEIIFRNHYTLTPYSKTTVSVKGLTINAKKTKSVVHMLIKKYFTQNMDSIPVNMYMSMDTKYSSMLNSQSSSENLIKLIYETTGANINFISSTTSVKNSYLSPSSSSVSQTILLHNQFNSIDYFSNFSNINQHLTLNKLNLNNHLFNQYINRKLNHIHIYGNVDNVFLARQLITNLLPVVLIFDVDILQGEWLENFNLTNLCKYYEVNLTIRNKPKDLVKSVVIKTREKNIRSLYIMWELIQELLSQFTKNTICKINNSSCLNSSIHNIQMQRLWPDDLRLNEESTKILSSTNKGKLHGDKEDNKLDREEIVLKYKTSFSTSTSSSPPQSFSLFHHDPSVKVNLLNRDNHLHLMGYESNTEFLPSFEHNGVWNKYGNFEENIDFYAHKKFIEENNGNS
ncbi:unnamed protein product [Schistosoma haematobium]|nr:unnamed protein product [Schistosoma haematobium]CAH8679909.1 unnamed protein product [Schistosoma haematobium]